MRWAFDSACCLMCSRFLRFPALALSASFLGIRKLRAYPSETSRTSPRRPTVATSSSRMIFMLASLVRRRVGQQGHRAGALDGVGELALVARAAAGDPARDDLAALGHEAPEPAHVLVVCLAHLVSAELANLAAAEPPPLDGLLCDWNGSTLLLKRHVVVAAVVLFREGRRGRDRRRGSGALALRAAHELDPLGHDLGGRALLTVLALPVARLQPALDEDLAALVEVLPARLGLLAPHHDGEEAHFLALLAALGAVVAVDRQAQIRHGGAARGVAQLRGTRQVADQQHLVQARHQTTSSTTS